MLVTHDDELARRCQLIRNHGENAVSPDEVATVPNFIGGNYRLTELQSAIGIAQLDRLEGYLETRQSLAAHMARRIESMDGLSTHQVPDDQDHAYYIFPIWYDATRVGMSRKLFVKSVLAELPEPRGFESTPLAEGLVKPLYLLEMYQQRRAMGRGSFPWSFQSGPGPDYSKGLCPVAEAMYERELMLSPLVREPLDTKDMDDIADAMEKVLAQASEIVDALGDAPDGGEVVTPTAVANARGTT
jgi:dTDP-4-amino-4,6-dideoxygalactose transaminase